jgi:hypothetical protein
MASIYLNWTIWCKHRHLLPSTILKRWVLISNDKSCQQDYTGVWKHTIGAAGEPAKLARFFLVQRTKTGENIPNDHTIYQLANINTNWPLKIMEVKYQKAEQYTKHSLANAFQIIPKLGCAYHMAIRNKRSHFLSIFCFVFVVYDFMSLNPRFNRCLIVK